MINIDKSLWENTEAKEFGEREKLELGGHELVIISVEEYTSESGNTSLKVAVDIAGNDKQAGFFKKQYENNNNSNKKWPNSGIKYVSLKSENIAYLKGFITCVENSNKGFKFALDGTWEQLNGKKVAGQFGLEEYIDDNGAVRLKTKLNQFRSIDKLDSIKIPSVKTISGGYVDYDVYMANYDSNIANGVSKATSESTVEVTDDDLPFEL